MKVGVALNMLHEHGRPDAAVVHEHLAEGDLVEPLGFIMQNEWTSAARTS